MIYQEIKNIIEDNKIKSELDNITLAKVAFYNIINKPYFNGLYDFVNLYKNLDDEIELGQEDNKISLPQIYNVHRFPLSNANLLASKIVIDEKRKKHSLILTDEEHENLQAILSKAQSMNSIADASKFTINEAALIGKISDGKLNLFIFEDLINGEEQVIYKKVFTPSNGVLTDQTVNSFLKKHNHITYFLNIALYEEKYGLKLNMINELSGKYQYIERILKEDNLQHLWKDHFRNDKDFLQKFTGDEFKNTIIGTLLEYSTPKEKIIKIFDILNFEQYKKDLLKKINILLQEETVENIIKNETKNLEIIEQEIMKYYPELNNTNYLEVIEIPHEKFENMNEVEVRNYVSNFTKDHLTTVGVIPDMSKEFDLKDMGFSPYEITSIFFDNRYEHKKKTDIILFKNNIEVLGAASITINPSELITEYNLDLHKFKPYYFNKEEVIKNYQTIIDYYKSKNGILNIYIDSDSDYSKNSIENRIKLNDILYELKTKNKDSIIINILNRSDDYTQLGNYDYEKYNIIKELKNSINISYTDLLNSVNKINSTYLLSNEHSTRFNAQDYEEISKSILNKYKVQIKNNNSLKI